uniref:Uncharacterized protein n=1 Tax=Glossina austeni TaxID=7395 RepID=A0A1A9VC42_GLOAU
MTTILDNRLGVVWNVHSSGTSFLFFFFLCFSSFNLWFFIGGTGNHHQSSTVTAEVAAAKKASVYATTPTDRPTDWLMKHVNVTTLPHLYHPTNIGAISLFEFAEAETFVKNKWIILKLVKTCKLGIEQTIKPPLLLVHICIFHSSNAIIAKLCTSQLPIIS